MEILTVEQVGKTRELTPEGFLLCRGAPIARTGSMLYYAEELQPIGNDGERLEPDSSGRIRVERRPEVVFSPETIASFQGKDVVETHTIVTPENYTSLTRGTVLNVRRGEGEDADYLLADLLIKDADCIAAIEAGRRGLSCGYSAEYEQTQPGVADTIWIKGNHVAIIPKGRCGPRCAIGDRESVAVKESSMPKRNVWDRLKAAFTAKDEDAFEKAIEEAKDTDPEDKDGVVIHNHVYPAPPKKEEADDAEPDDEPEDPVSAKMADFDARLKRIEQAIDRLVESKAAETDDEDPDEMMDPEDAMMDEAEDPMPKRAVAKDSATSLRATFRQVVADAEILQPGIRLPVFDAALSLSNTAKRLCAFRRRALMAAMDGSARVHVEAVYAGAPIRAMPCDGVKVLFDAAVLQAKRANNARGSGRRAHVAKDAATEGYRMPTPEEFNRRARERHNQSIP